MKNVRGDRIKSISFIVTCSNSNLAVLNAILTGTLCGQLNSTAVPDSGGRFSVYGYRDSLNNSAADSIQFIILQLLVYGKESFISYIWLDSLLINGYAEPFQINPTSGFDTIYFQPISAQEMKMNNGIGTSTLP